MYQTNLRLGKSLERLSSGMRINRAADDAAGLGVSEKLRSQVEGLEQASNNCMDGISIIQTAEGALDRVHAMLRRIRNLTEASANGDKTDDDRLKYQAEVDQLLEEIDRISNTTEYNTKKLLNGTLGISITDDISKLDNTLTNPAATVTDDIMQSVKVTGDVGRKGVYTIQLETTLDSNPDKEANTQYAAGRSIQAQAHPTAQWQGTDTLQAAFNMVAAGESETLSFVQPHTDNEVQVTLSQADTVNEAVGKLQKALDRSGFEVDVTWEPANGNGTFLFAARNRGSESNFYVSGRNSTGVGNEKMVGNDPMNGSLNQAGGEDVGLDGYDEGNGAGIDAVVISDPADAAFGDFQVNIVDPNGSMTLVTSRSSTFTADMETQDKDKLIDDTGDNQGIAGIEFTLALDDINASWTDGAGANPVKAGLDLSGLLTVQAGPNKGDDHRISIAIDDMSVQSLGISRIDISTQDAAFNLIDSEKIDRAISTVSMTRGNLGALQNRLEHTIQNLGVTKENLASSESRIRDTDMAAEMSEFTRNQIMSQAGVAMLAQANQVPQQVLQLLG
jgi:flagellin